MKKMTAALASVCILTGLTTAGAAALNGFSDKEGFADWFAPAAEKMHYNKIITGYEDGSFGADKNVTRAELAVMLDRFANAIEKPLAEGPTACTMQYVYGLTLHVQDQNGLPIEEADISVLGLEGEEGAFGGMEGSYAGFGEAEGYRTYTVTKEGYTAYTETIKLEKDDCHVIPQVRTITLYQLPAEEEVTGDEALTEGDEVATEEEETTTEE